jgi:hypothetical protein
VLEQRGDPPVAVAPVLARQRDDVSRQRILIRAMRRLIALCATPLLEDAARLPFAHRTFRAHVPPPCAAQGLEGPSATFFRIAFPETTPPPDA